MRKSYLFLVLALFFSLTKNAHAAVEQRISVSTSGENSSVNVNSEINATSQTSYSSTGTNSVSISQSGGDENKVVIKNNNFELTGTITESTDNGFRVSGQKVYIDKSKVSNFSQSGSLIVGSKVNVSGIVISGALYAQKINVSNASSTTPPKSSPTSNTTPSPTPTISPTPSPSPTPTVLGASTKNPMQTVIDALQDVINTLKSIFRL